MVTYSEIIEYYSKKEVQKAMVEFAKNREVVGVYSSGSFDKRPNIISFEEDILQLVKKGIVAFHCSVERWSNAMKLDVNMTVKEMEDLRIGWDLVIDPDCPFELSKIATRKIVEMLEEYKIRCYSVKFTGGKSFHIFLPFEAFPKKLNNKPLNALYPEVPKILLEYIKSYIKDELRDEILGTYSLKDVGKIVGKPQEELLNGDEFDPFKAVSLDTAIASPRHLFRMPYSLHEKNLLVSLPVEDVENFEREDASIENFKYKGSFMKEVKAFEAAGLLIDAMDFAKKIEPEIRKEKINVTKKGKYFGKESFPPCIKKLLMGGLSDGRKRGLFILITFLRNAGWNWEQIENEINEWNSKNKPLSARYINTQIRWFKQQKKELLPPNCNHPFYKELGLCEGCEDIKNPLNYLSKRRKS
ncbi:MAG: hypothetical protein QXO84_00155 [Candidatus Aenigmatarchaeota archaeon]